MAQTDRASTQAQKENPFNPMADSQPAGGPCHIHWENLDRPT